MAPTATSGVLGKTDWNDPRAIATAMKDIFEQRELKRDLEARAARNIAFYEGRQSWEWHEGRRQMVFPRRLKKVADLLIYNIIKPLMVQKLAKMARSEPVWKVPSYTTDEFDQMVARFSNDLMGYYYLHGLRVPEIVEDLLRNIYTSPVTFLEPGWDPILGEAMDVTLDDFYREIPQEATNEMADQMRGDDLTAFRGLLGANGREEGDNRPVVQYTGDLSLHIRSIFKVMWYPFHVEQWSDVHAYLISEVMTPEEVSMRTGMPIDEVLANRNSIAAHDFATHRLVQGWTSPFIDTPVVDPENDYGIIVHRLFGDRRLAGPGGVSAMLIGASDEAIGVGKIGNKLDRLPLRAFVEHPSPDTAWGTCSVDDAICAQIDFNDAATQRGRARRQRVRPRIIRDKNDGSGPTGASALEWNKPDAVYEVNHMERRPQLLVEPPTGQDDTIAIQFNMEFLHDVMAVPAVALGRTDEIGKNASGRLALALQEEANERNKLVGKLLNIGFSWVGEILLSLLQSHAVKERLTPIAGDNNAVEFKAWSRASLQPTMYAQHPASVAIVTVDSFSNIPSTTAERRQLVVALLELGVLKAGEDDAVIRDAFGFGTDKEILEAGRAGRDRAEAKVIQWRQGQNAPPVMQSDDHESAVPIISAFIASDDFRQIAQERPDIAGEAVMHLDSHQQQIHDEKAREVMRAMYAQARIAAEFSFKAQQDRLPGMAMMFGAMANGMPVGGVGAEPGKKDEPKNEDRGDGAAGNKADGERERRAEQRADERSAVS